MPAFNFKNWLETTLPKDNETTSAEKTIKTLFDSNSRKETKDAAVDLLIPRFINDDFLGAYAAYGNWKKPQNDDTSKALISKIDQSLAKRAAILG